MIYKKKLNHIIVSFILIFALIFLGTLGYTLIEGWNLLDSLYMTIITITTTGFEEVHPLSKNGRIFTILLIIFGIIIIAYILGKIVELTFGFKVLRRRRMNKKIEELKEHFIICGFGRTGRIICNELKEKSAEFVVIEKDPAVIEKIEELGYLYVEGDGSEDEILRKAGITKAKGIVAVLKNDSDNVFVTLTAKSLNPNVYIISRALEEESRSKFLKAGASFVINTYEIEGTRIAELLMRPGIIEFVNIIIRDKRIDLNLEEVRVSKGSNFIEKTLSELSFRKIVNVIIVSAYKKDGSFVFNPGSDYKIEEGDKLIVLGENREIEKIKNLCFSP